MWLQIDPFLAHGYSLLFFFLFKPTMKIESIKNDQFNTTRAYCFIDKLKILTHHSIE